MSLSFGVTLPAATVTALRESAELQQVINLLATIRGAYQTVHEIVRAVATGVEGLPFTISHKVHPGPATILAAKPAPFIYEPNAVINVTIRDLMMKDEGFKVTESLSLSVLLSSYCERSGTDMRKLTFSWFDTGYTLEEAEYSETLKKVRPRLLYQDNESCN